MESSRRTGSSVRSLLGWTNTSSGSAAAALHDGMESASSVRRHVARQDGDVSVSQVEPPVLASRAP
jgi:hypothetical protein